MKIFHFRITHNKRPHRRAYGAGQSLRASLAPGFASVAQASSHKACRWAGRYAPKFSKGIKQ